MSDASYYRNFCMKAPRPSLIRVYTGEDVHDLEVAPDVNWARLGETIDALGPEKIELYNEQQNLIRADKKKLGSRAGVMIPSALHTDPETARIHHFADLLARAYEHTTDVAFGKLVEMMEMQMEERREISRRLERLEREHFETVRENIELATGAEGDAGGDLLGAFMSGMGGAKATNGAPTS